jgi:hypothetical protein
VAKPFAELKPIDPATLARYTDWAGRLAAFEDWTADLEPFDDDAAFDDPAHPEINPRAGLPADRSMLRTPTRRLFVDYRANPDAFRHLKRLPKEGQSLHGVISGKYALFDLVPAILERTGDTIADLYLVTLGFSKQNGADLCGMLDGRQVRRSTLLCSMYFQQTSPGIYDAVIPELLKRKQRVKAFRCHGKIILARMKGGARYVVESSANLRSCKNVEQFALHRCTRLYAFHRRWVEDVVTGKTRAAG